MDAVDFVELLEKASKLGAPVSVSEHVAEQFGTVGKSYSLDDVDSALEWCKSKGYQFDLGLIPEWKAPNGPWHRVRFGSGEFCEEKTMAAVVAAFGHMVNGGGMYV